ncbi:MAG: hypothetical protein U5L11_17555 [Arhodomonas sp.]|nr:hypothetical protein [Arhodomonas sp.]
MTPPPLDRARARPCWSTSGLRGQRASRAARRAGYRPPLPVPLWGAVTELGTGSGEREGDDPDADDPEGGSAEAGEGKRKASRRRQDQSERDDPLVLNRFEKLLAWAEMVNVNRMVEDEEEEAAKRAADDLDEITLSPHQQRAATRLKVDLDLPPNAVTGSPLARRADLPGMELPPGDLPAPPLRGAHLRTIGGGRGLDTRRDHPAAHPTGPPAI